MFKEIGWYIDTSVFLSFIDRNIRVGFKHAEPSNGKTILHVKCSETKRQMWVPFFSSNGMRYAFELTSNLSKLQDISLVHNKTYYYSELIKAEIFRNLRKTHSGAKKTEIVKWWDAFCYLMKNYKILPIDFNIDRELSDLALEFPLKRNVQDYIHLLIAKKHEKAFITSDKFDNQLLELKKNYYQNIHHISEIKEEYKESIFT